MYKYLFVLILVSFPVQAFELATHGYMTYHSFEKSDLFENPETFKDLGVHSEMTLGGSAESREIFYYDFSDTTSDIRRVDIFSTTYIPSTNDKQGNDFKSSLNPSGWLMRGAIREDDNTDAVEKIGQPDDNPYKQEYGYFLDSIRVVNHFFDPALNRPLTVPFSTLYRFRKAVDWGIGATNALTDENNNETERLNHFTVRDAREAMFRALVGAKLDYDGSLDKSVGMQCSSMDSKGIFQNCQPRAATEQDRLAYWATTFRTLGDIVHILQDMGQPQHTRNDPHSGKGNELIEEWITGHESAVEGYIEARATGSSTYQVGGPGGVTRTYLNHAPLNYDGYPIPTFHGYAEAWSTSQGVDGIVNGKGLADYSNRGFFSFGTGLGNNEYHHPSNDRSYYQYARSVRNESIDEMQYYLRGKVNDRLFPFMEKQDVALTTESVWKDSFTNEHDLLYGQELEKYKYTTDLTVYDETVALTIPRAVAYSAGLINYFFRGRMEIMPPDDGIYGLIDATREQGVIEPGIPVVKNTTTVFGFKKVKLKIRNTSPAGENMGADGQLRVVAKYRRNMCYQGDLSGEYGWGDSTGFPTGCTETTFTGGEEYISVSEPVILTGDIRQPTEFTFEFSPTETLPINAYNLFLQVVYRGPLGNEADAVVVATKDIFEPVYVAQMNDTDTLCFNDKIVLNTVDDKNTLTEDERTSLGYLTQVAPISFENIGFTFGKASAPQVTISLLKPGEYARFAVLTEQDQTPVVHTINKEIQVTPTNKLTWRVNDTTVHASTITLEAQGKLAASATRISTFRGIGYREGKRFRLEASGDGACTASDTLETSNRWGLPSYVPVGDGMVGITF